MFKFVLNCFSENQLKHQQHLGKASNNKIIKKIVFSFKINLKILLKNKCTGEGTKQSFLQTAFKSCSSLNCSSLS